MRRCLKLLREDPGRAEAVAHHGRRAIEERHTCRHRVDELLKIIRETADAWGGS